MVRVNDPAGKAGNEVGYEVSADETWAERALDLYKSRQLQVQAFNTDGVVSAQVWGTCPRCTHSLDVQMTLSAPVVTWRGGWSSIGRGDPEVPEEIDVGCGCGIAHQGAPESVTGCGVSFPLPTAAPPAP
jgi:hypothetical protein